MRFCLCYKWCVMCKQTRVSTLVYFVEFRTKLSRFSLYPKARLENTNWKTEA